MKRPVLWLVIILLLVPSTLIAYRIFFLGYPLFPSSRPKAWEISMDAHTKAKNGNLIIKIGLPHSRQGQIITEERFTSGSLDFNLLKEGVNRIGVWTGSVGAEGEIIGYRMIILLTPQSSSKLEPPSLEPYPHNIGNSEKELVSRLVSRWIQLEPPLRLRAIAAIAKDDWGDPLPEDRDIKAWYLLKEKHGVLISFMTLLRAAELPSRVVEGIWLTEGVTSVPITWIEVWTGKEWEGMLPSSGEIYQGSTKLLPLVTGEMELIRLSNGELSDARWTLRRQIVSEWRHHFERIRESPHLIDRWSLFHLPSEFQETFRILILVPIGALMICILRNLVGFPTFGVFMPVLMALAFRNTGLIYGLGIFGGIVFIGYASRKFIERLRLLLVPRLSVLLTFVILCIIAVALIGNKLGLWRLMAVGLLPFVILTMTIERFFIIIEESGVRDGFRTALGSALVAFIAYEILHLEVLQLTFFVYPELFFAVAAAQMILGRYTGYRLSEFIRFRKFRSP